MVKRSATDDHSARNPTVDHQAMVKKIMDHMRTEVDSIEESIIGRMQKISSRLDSLDNTIDSLIIEAGLQDAVDSERSDNCPIPSKASTV
ncbi:unnamed protein product [Cylindrotheca closterium]|uniref:Uncharacterized protein n=1 Tax=Cylindrotheca closterium TaxID=2856 RepID=A0AAD2JLE8_9STRA|nr:unnamed protein product [Cylindrotheca closterium]